jgi:hypothetical protein
LANLCGSQRHWGIPALVEIALKECGELPSLTLPYHRVGGRLWHYEKIRLTLKDVKAYGLHKLIEDPDKNAFTIPENLTARAWLEKWFEAPDSDEFKHPFEPRSWPPKAASETLSIRITHDRKVYFDPLCAPIIYISKLSDGKAAATERVGNLPAPQFSGLMPGDVKLSLDGQEQLHPGGCSLRYKEISKRKLA